MTTHAIFNRPIEEAVPQGLDQAIFGMGCYWPAERLFWQQNGVWLTQVGFAGGTVENPGFDQVQTGTTGHAQVVRVVYDSSKISYDHLLQLFWENHDPTRPAAGDAAAASPSGGDPLRSLIMTFTDSQQSAAEASRIDYDNRLAVAGFGKITTQIIGPAPFWPAPDEHQQYLQKHPETDCELKGTGVEASLPNPDPI